MKNTHWAIFLLVCCLTLGCKSLATVACTNVAKFQSEAGVINIPQFKIGDVILIDTIKKTTAFILNTKIDNGSISTSTTNDSTVMLTNTGFAIDLSGKVSKASASVQADLKSAISNNTTFFLSNSVRKNISNPFNEINKTNNLPAIKAGIVNNKNTICMLVLGIIYADKFEFRVKNSSGASANANILRFGNFSVNVKYECQGSLKIDAKQGGMFYKYSFYSLNNTQDQLVPKSIKIDLTQYSFIQAFE